ncbi:ATP-binding cassette domain-containing protein, partial [Streptomyces sp. NPDC006237]
MTGTRSTALPARGLRFLLARRRVLLRLAAWSVLETGQTFLIGYGPARALDAGFLRGRPDVGLAWLAVTGLGVLLGAYGTARVYAAVAALVEPLRDRLVERVVSRGVRTGDAGALSGLTQQVEIARDTFAGLVMVSRSFVFTAAGALAGLFALAPPLLLVVGPPLAAGVVLFAATLRPLARRQEAFLVADEALAGHLGTVCPGLRDITATGAQAQLASATDERVEAELRAARALARWGVLRVASLAIGGQLPIVLLLATAPWLLSHGVTTGALVGALAYVTQSLLPALRNLVHGLGTSGSRLTVVLRRLTADPARAAAHHTAPALAQGDRAAEAGETPVSAQGYTTTAGREPPATAQGDTTTAGREPPATAQGDTATATHETPATAQGDTATTTHEPPATTQGDTATATHETPGTAAGGGAAAAHETHLPGGPSPEGTRGRPGGRGSPDAAGRTADGQDRATADVGTPGGNAESARAEATAAPPPALSLSSVTFAYGPASSPVVDGLDLDLVPGAHLAVVGPSGAGKSTLTALVAGLLTPDRGTITVGGHAVPGPEAAAARVLIPQEAYVFDGTLAENLAYLRPDPVPEEDLVAAAEAVGLAPLADR